MLTQPQSSLEPVSRAPVTPRSLPPVPWRDPHSVPPAQMAAFINQLRASCELHPASADLRACLGIAHAMNYDVHRSMDTLEEAVLLDPRSFFAQIKLGELFYRLRALIRAEEETLKALELAENHWELSLARKQLAEIRSLSKAGIVRPVLLKPLLLPAAGLILMVLAAALATVWHP